MRNKLIISFFCVLLAVCALAGLFIPDKYYSEREKRTLTQAPKFSASDFFSGKFGDKLETYLADQVPLRDKWITLKTYLELGIGKRESGGVYICNDKYLMDKFTSYSQKQLAANAEALAELQKKLAEEGISVSTMLVPVAAQVLSDKLPAYAPVADYAAILKVLSDAGVNVTDIMSILAAHSDEAICYRTTIIGQALAALMPNFRFVEEHSLTEGMAQFVPIYKVLDRIPAIRNISNKIMTLKKV